MKKSIKEQTINAFQTGGAVDPQTGVYQIPGTGITGFQQAPTSTTGFTPNQPIQPYFTPTQFTQAQYQDPLQVTNIPTFADTVGSGFGQYDEERTYINDAGQILKVPFKDGKPLFPIPEGYSEYSEQGAAPTEEAPATTIPLTGQTTTRDTGGDRENTATVTPTTKAARNVYKGYSKGYAGLSTAFGSGTGGLSEAAAQAKKDFGITGQQTGNLGSLAAFVATAAGVPFALSSTLAGKGGYLIDKPVSPGAIGSLSYEDLVGIATGAIPSNAKVSQELAENVIMAQANYGVNFSGKIGYNSGDINPITGTPVKNGMAVNSAFGPGVTTASYATVRDMKNVIEKGIAAGWRGGYIDKKAYDGLSAKAKENYNKFDNTHQQNDLIGNNKEALQAYLKGNQPMQDNITGTPTSMDVEKAFAAADAAADSGRETSSPSPERGGDDKSPGGVGVDASGASTGFGSGDECLTENMKVKLNGVIDFVTNIKVGDTIDGSIVKEVLHKHMRSGYFVINNELEITNDHPVWAKSGGLGKADWTRPEQLVVGDTINGIKVTSLNYVDRMTPTVAIVIDGDSFDVYTEGNTYTVHGRYREVRQEAA
jgi:hypothetical protein